MRFLKGYYYIFFTKDYKYPGLNPFMVSAGVFLILFVLYFSWLIVYFSFIKK